MYVYRQKTIFLTFEKLVLTEIFPRLIYRLKSKILYAFSFGGTKVCIISYCLKV